MKDDDPTKIKENILKIESLNKTYLRGLFFPKKYHVVKNLSCSFPKGKCTALMGHNGAGKTSTIRAILNLTKCDSGKILFKNKSISKDDHNYIGYMPEINKLPLNLTPEEFLGTQINLYSPKHIKRKDYQALIKTKLKDVGLINHCNKRISELSKGMGRRLAWAGATIHDPELLILDEPFSGLDPEGRICMKSWIKDLKQSGKSLILCTHEISSIPSLCDELHILKHGRLVYSTLDPFEGEEAAKKDEIHHNSYSITISGGDQGKLEALAKKMALPDISQIIHDGYLMKLYFSDYPKAASWLKACLSENYIIIKFEESEEINELKLYHYFSGGEK
ncbi:MAG: ABC transporter ATP-binding protein [Oligoflexales bacterium]|nr:ABC transporter ATP-binding protein [Oligoflexales bacterium]